MKEAKEQASFEVKRAGNSVERTLLGGIIKAIEIVKNNIDTQIAQTETMQKQAGKALNSAIAKLNQNEHGQKMAKFLDKEFGSGNTIDSMEQFKTISKLTSVGISILKNKQLERSEKFINNNKDRISEQQILKMSEKLNQNQDIVRDNFENMKNNGYDFSFPEKEDMSEWKDAVGEGMKVDWSKPSSNSIESKTNDDIDIAE